MVRGVVATLGGDTLVPAAAADPPPEARFWLCDVAHSANTAPLAASALAASEATWPAEVAPLVDATLLHGADTV